MIQRILKKIEKESLSAVKKTKQFMWLKSSEGRENNERLLDLRNKYAGKRCVVMANGPSLKLCDLKVLKNEITIASNAQFLIWDEMGYVPTFLTVEDRLVAEDRAKELNGIKSTTKIFPLDLSYCLKYDGQTVFTNFIRDYKPFPTFTDKFHEIVYWGGTVSFLNLQLAYYLGCKEIYLIGFDHNYKVTEKIENFVITSDKDDVNHIHPNYFGKGYRWHDPNVERMEQSYRIAKEFLDRQGVKVYNATIGGKLEVFDRADYKTIFG
jgi:hypothetical protein